MSYYGARVPSTLRPAGPCSDPGARGTPGRGAIPAFRHLPGAVASDPFKKAARGNARFQGAREKKQTRSLGRLLPPKGPNETVTSAAAYATTLRGSSLESPPSHPPTKPRTPVAAPRSEGLAPPGLAWPCRSGGAAAWIPPGRETTKEGIRLADLEALPGDGDKQSARPDRLIRPRL